MNIEKYVEQIKTNFPEYLDDNECLDLPYSVLKKFNEQTRGELDVNKDEKYFKDRFIEFLKSEEGIQGVQVYYPSIEGRLHKFEYDRESFIDGHDFLTFDGSSIKGFSEQSDSDLQLMPIFSTGILPPAEAFGSGRFIFLGRVVNKNGEPYSCDFTNLLIDTQKKLEGMGLKGNIAPEIEGFLLKGQYAEQKFNPDNPFLMASESGYAGAAAGDDLIDFINKLARVTRAMGYRNEKDHPEVAKGQFELNYKHADPLHSAYMMLLYRQIAKNIAHKMEMTATFLPKPKAEVNGSGMHTNISLSDLQTGKNIFHEEEGLFQLSEKARKFISGILMHGPEVALAYNATSGNGARRNDPSKEAPVQFIADTNNRAAVIRVPHHNSKSARVEVRAVAPDAHPMLAFAVLLRAGIKGMLSDGDQQERYLELLIKDRDIEVLPGSFHEALEKFNDSDFAQEVIGEHGYKRYLEIKQDTADKLPRNLGKKIKEWEIKGHHLVVNQDIAESY